MKKIAKEYQTTSNSIKVIKCDIQQPQQIIDACKQIKSWCNNNLNLLVNNAGGGSGSDNSLENITVENWDFDLNLNLRHTMIFTQQLISALRYAAANPIKYNGNVYDGSVVNISSAASTDTVWSVSIAYSVAKAGLDQLTRLNAMELAKYKIRVNGLKLGGVKTNAFVRVLVHCSRCLVH